MNWGFVGVLQEIDFWWNSLFLLLPFPPPPPPLHIPWYAAPLLSQGKKIVPCICGGGLRWAVCTHARRQAHALVGVTDEDAQFVPGGRREEEERNDDCHFLLSCAMYIFIHRHRAPLVGMHVQEVGG